MRAAIWNNESSLDIVERDRPEPRPGWVRVRVDTVGICGTDLHFLRGSFPSPAGLLPGHEISGVVDIYGSDTPEALAPGTAVAVEPLVGCGRCRSCLGGQYNRCATRTLFGVNGRGGLADYVTVPAQCLYALPPTVPVGLGSMAEPLAVCARGTRLAGIVAGDRVAILGAGTIGLASILSARAAGAAEISITARHVAQRDRAAALGATVVEPGAQLRDMDVVIETVGANSDTLLSAVAMTRPGGTIAMLGVFEGQTPLPALDFATRELRLIGSNCYSRAAARTDFEVGLDLLQRWPDEVAGLITHHFRLDEVNEAFATAAEKSTGSVKVVLHP